jgi:hypothetical protein
MKINLFHTTDQLLNILKEMNEVENVATLLNAFPKKNIWLSTGIKA